MIAALKEITRLFVLQLFVILAVITLAMTTQAGASSPKIVAISAGPAHCLALGADGTVWEWGSNWRGELTGIEDPSRIPHPVPMMVPISNVTAIAAGDFDSVALKDDGTVWTWGHLANEMTGDTDGITNVTKIVQVPITNVTKIYAGINWAFAVKDDGSLWAWGDTSRGYLGNGEYTTQESMTDNLEVVPVRTLVSNVTYVDPEGCFAIEKNGSIWMWGDNVLIANPSGPLAYLMSDLTHDAVVPIPIKTSLPSDITSIATGNMAVLALKKDGTLWAWGSDYYGLFGDGGMTGLYDANTNAPRTQSSLVKAKIDNVKAIAADNVVAIALKNDGTVWTWGETPNSFYGSSTPSMVDGLSNVVAVSAGECDYMALKSDGTVWAWGDNTFGQAGVANQQYVSSPTQVQMDYGNKMPEPLIVTTDQLPNVTIERTVPTYSPDTNATPSPTINNNSSDDQRNSSNDQGTTQQGNGLLMAGAGLLLLIVLAAGGIYLFRKK